MKKLIQRYYDRVRPHLPRRKGTYRGYIARDVRLLDATTARPNYKEGLVAAIEEHVPEQDVCIIGFGRGISSMIAIENGAKSVTAYEASAEMIQVGLEAFTLNDISSANLTVKHAVVGESIDIFGSSLGADVISPSELEPEDVMILDCEGAEISILQNLVQYPNILIVETHPPKGAPTKTVYGLLDDIGYTVVTTPYENENDSKNVLIGIFGRESD